MNSSKFGKTIAKQRKRMGLTQSELASKLGITDKAISKWESGGGYPEITQLPILSEIFGVSIDYLMKGNSKGIVVAGNILADVVNTIDRYPERGGIAGIEKTVCSVGGCVPNTLIDLAKIDSELFLTAVGTVGEDEMGRFVTSEMRRYGIDVSNVTAARDVSTGQTSVMAERTTGERTLFHSRGANALFSPDNVDIDRLDCEIFHIGYIMLLDKMDEYDREYGTALARLLHDLKKAGIKTSIDAVMQNGASLSQKVLPALAYSSYTIMDEAESAEIAGISVENSDGSINEAAVRKTAERFFACGVSEKVIIHSRHFGYIMDKAGKFTAVPALKLNDGYIRGNVGVGDAFAAGCLYGLYNDYNDEKILSFASKAAALSLSEPDSTSGMRAKEKIEAMGKA